MKTWGNRFVFKHSPDKLSFDKPKAEPVAADFIGDRQAADPSKLLIAQADPAQAEEIRGANNKKLEEVKMYLTTAEGLKKDISTQPEGFSIHYTVNGEADVDPAKINLFDKSQSVHMTVHLNRQSPTYTVRLSSLARLQKLPKTPKDEEEIGRIKKVLAQLNALIDNNIPIYSILKVAGSWQIIFTAKKWLGKKSGEEEVAIDVNGLNNSEAKWNLSELMKEIARKVPGRLKGQTLE